MMMKNKISATITASLILAFVAVSVFTSCDRELDRPPIDVVDTAKILTIGDLYQIHADSGDEYTFVDDYMLYATVIMDDSSGNIYKEAYLQDETGGINLYKLSGTGIARVGQYLRINLNGASLKYYSGKMEIVFSAILDAGKNIVVQKEFEPIAPVEVTIADIRSAEFDCELITLVGVQFADSDTAMTYAVLGGTGSQNRNIVDCDGNSMIIRNSDYSLFAGDELPNGNGNMTGIITKYIYTGGDTAWQLLIRNPDEVLLNNPRCGSEK
jgi:hypothetical protein